MKLLLHNMLASNVKGITTRFPLAIVNVRKVEVLENEFDEELAVGSLARIEYDALRAAAVQVWRRPIYPARWLAAPPSLTSKLCSWAIPSCRRLCLRMQRATPTFCRSSTMRS